MIPIVVDPKQSAMALIGRGQAAERRLELLLAGGARADRRVLRRALAAPGRAGRASAAPPPAFRRRACALRAAVDRGPADRRGSTARARRQGRRLPRQRRGRRRLLRLPQSLAGAPRRPAAHRLDRRQEPGPRGAHPRPAGPCVRPRVGRRLERIGDQRNAWRREEHSLEDLARLTNATIDANGWLPKDAASKDLRS